MQQPFFSIIIPTYNREDFVSKTLNSFLQQTFTDFEILIIDDGGKDKTKTIVASFNDERVSYFWKENGERGAARNYGATKAKGRYFNFFDSDDIAYPQHLQVAYDLLKNSEENLLFLGFEFINAQGNFISRVNNYNGNVEKDIVNRNKRNLNSVFIKKSVFNEIKFEENRLMAASEDTLLLCRMVARYEPTYKNIITSAMIEHDGRSMVTASEIQLLGRRKILLEKLAEDEVFMGKYAANLKNINGEMSYSLCLSCLTNKENKKALGYFKESLRAGSTAILSKRTLVLLKKIFKNIF